MNAEQALLDGSLDEALTRLQDQVRGEPASAKHRVFLFQLLSVLGQWDRALNQLNVVGELDAATLPMVQTYREALRCEALRREVFDGARSPLVLGEPGEWIALMLEALKLTAAQSHEQAASLRERALEAAEPSAGAIDGAAFEWIADADSRLGPALEAIVNGRYYWIPFANIAVMRFEAPQDLRDLVWCPCFFTWTNGGEAAGLIPTRYPGSESSDDAMIRMARKTEWVAQGDADFGMGQRLLATDAGEYALMDIREVTFSPAEA